MLRLYCQTAFDGFFSDPITVFYVMLLKKHGLMDLLMDKKDIMLNLTNQIFAYNKQMETQQNIQTRAFLIVHNMF